MIEEIFSLEEEEAEKESEGEGEEKEEEEVSSDEPEALFGDEEEEDGEPS